MTNLWLFDQLLNAWPDLTLTVQWQDATWQLLLSPKLGFLQVQWSNKAAPRCWSWWFVFSSDLAAIAFAWRLRVSCRCFHGGCVDEDGWCCRLKARTSVGRLEQKARWCSSLCGGALQLRSWMKMVFARRSALVLWRWWLLVCKWWRLAAVVVRWRFAYRCNYVLLRSGSGMEVRRRKVVVVSWWL